MRQAPLSKVKFAGLFGTCTLLGAYGGLHYGTKASVDVIMRLPNDSKLKHSMLTAYVALTLLPIASLVVLAHVALPAVPAQAAQVEPRARVARRAAATGASAPTTGDT